MNIKLNRFNKLLIGFYSIIVALFLFFYINYSFNAWFFQDDFSLLYSHKDRLDFFNILNIENNFGRFISRDLYWHVLYKFFGTNASMFYIVNFLIMIVNTFILYKIINLKISNQIWSMVFALFYITNTATFSSFIWISNSQHLLGHLFVFICIYILMKIYYNPNKIAYLILTLSFICGIYSNVFIVFLLPLVLFNYIFLKIKVIVLLFYY